MAMVTGSMPSRLLRLDVGEPDFDTPPHIVEAAARALHDGATRYGAPEGLPRLRDAVADRLREHGVAASADRVTIGAGAKPLLCATFRALAGPGDEVLVPDPGYPGYRAAVALSGAAAVPYPVTDDAGAFDLDVDAIASRVGPRSRVLVLNSPHNPTGGVCAPRVLDAVAALAIRHDLHVVSDEVYSAIVFAGTVHESIAARPGMIERTALIDSFSKTYAMTGWRLGFAHLPARIAAAVRTHILQTATCTPGFVQEAGIAALTGPQACVGAMVRSYASRRDAFVGALRQVPGLDVRTPDGAFYLFPRLADDSPGSSARATAQLHEEQALACASGDGYGSRGEGHLRLSFAAPEAVLVDAADRLARHLAVTAEAVA